MKLKWSKSDPVYVKFRITGHCEKCFLFRPRCIFQKQPQERRCSIIKVFLKISQNSQENACARVSFNIVACLRPATLLKKETLVHVFCEFGISGQILEAA